ncbi:MAG TPA: bifunctional ornithine acetyltransferase/N-acetylglutamate synthase, partial [Clostridia bacterium]|nr:bifunctional ornithine acetyltransferase/N-acetylglutamate synthase [Clostridia bacterium]
MKNEATEIKYINGGVTAPRGYVAAGIHCGIKKDNSPDLAILYSETPCSAFAVFTKNRVKGHSLLLSMENISKGRKHCIFINSGNANACIGDRGMQDARTIALTCAQKLGISAHEVLTASTGVIGSPLPMDKILPGIESACQNLSAAGGSDAASAIMTTDTFSKEYSVKVELSGHTVTIGGMAKGSGMIHPNMATMIAVITTDADIESGMMEALVRESVDSSFNRI